MLTENSLRTLMANLRCHLPSFGCASQKQCNSSTFLHQQLRYSILRFPQISRPRNVVITATSSSSSTKNPSVKKRRTRAGKPVKSSSELCNELKEFVALVGLPQGHVPSWKELTEHGRKDLANLVRRRGYKLITELLTDSQESTITSVENQDENDDCENVLVGPDEKSDRLAKIVSADLDEKDSAPSDDYNFSWSSVDLAEKESEPSDNFIWSSTVLPEKESAPSDDNFNWSSAVLAEKESAPSDDNSKWSSADMAEKETATGDDNFSWSSAVLVEKESAPSDGKISWSPDDSAENVSAPSDDNFSWDIPSKDNTGQPPIIDDTQSSVESSTSSSMKLKDRAAKFVLDGVLDAIEGEVYEGERLTKLVAESPYSEESSNYKAAESDAISTFAASTEVSELVAPPATEYRGYRDYLLSAEELDSSQYNEHQRELELTQLKERIEKEKIALSNLQAKAEMEISKSQEIIIAKHEELQAAEESLSGLKEVEIEFLGNHETVEVAGSFNGWHQPIYMDPVPSSTSTIESRKLNLWSTKLWLYPGVYEIKFIVDGHWTIDPQRETTSRGTIQNNILRVER
ncbi:protein PTST homolog 3, chloroplastic-like isoform X2 [Papaver somniferum]|uniref:protein PTST homolog 3, chloroplastic-like isoform X2 n=1 Tax=Papaver somniferum TaxID=3469 RepID=UPI000E6F6126|nr:protein PTST homolog 3, chloroplastic-like isoform X2 [Papaver somniferum]